MSRVIRLFCMTFFVGMVSTKIRAQPCEISISALSLGNGWWEFFATGDPEVYPMFWTFDGQEPLEATWVVMYQFEPGIHEVCGFVLSGQCPNPVGDCITVEVEPYEPCTPVQINFTVPLAVAEGLTVGMLLTNDSGLIFLNQDFSFSPTNLWAHSNLCLPYGCYLLEVCGTRIQPSNAQGLEVDGLVLTEEPQWFPDDDCPLRLRFSVFSDCSASVQDHSPDQLLLFPNPTGNKITIQRKFPDCSQLVITDATGRQMHSWNGCSTIDSIGVEGWPDGVYFLRADGRSHRIIIAR